MDCETCGCYRPSWEIAPIADLSGRLIMACASCRRVTDREDASPVRLDPARIGGRAVIITVPMT